ncbi:MAG: hypothetical protein WC688_07235 [Parachlamydiales bacterium]
MNMPHTGDNNPNRGGHYHYHNDYPRKNLIIHLKPPYEALASSSFYTARLKVQSNLSMT